MQWLPVGQKKRNGNVMRGDRKIEALHGSVMKMYRELGVIKTTSKPGGLTKKRIDSEHVLRSKRGLGLKHRQKIGFR